MLDRPALVTGVIGRGLAARLRGEVERLGLVLPRALVPYLAALALWLGAPLLALARLLRRLLPHPLTPVAALIFPATARCLISGQNGILSAALLAGGLLGLATRPVLAGLLL